MVFLLLITGTLAVVLPITYFSSVEIIKNQSVLLNNKLVQMGTSKLDTSIEEVDKIFHSLYINKDFRNFINSRSQNSENGFNETYAGMKNVLHSYVNSRRDIFSIVYLDSDYIVYVARNEAGYERTSDRNNMPRWLPDAIEKLQDKDTGRLVISTHRHIPINFRITASDELIFSIARGIINVEKDYSVTGTLFINLDLSSFRKITDDIKPYSDSFTYILSPDGTVVYDSTNVDTASVIDKKVADKFSRQSGNAQVRLRGRDFIAVYSTSEVTGWKIINLIPVAQYSANVALVTRVVIIICILAVMLSVLVTLYVSRLISNPIERLSGVMNEIDLTNMDVRVDESRRDEIGVLSRSFNSLITKLRDSIRREYEAGIRQKDAELKALQAQINPHFLYNVLQSISSIAVLNDVQEINIMAKALGRMLRYSINTDDNITTIENEIDHVESYLAIQKVRFGEKLEYFLDIPQYVKKCRVLKLSIQPIVENAILHGFEGKLEKGIICIKCSLEKDCVVFEISDNGAGIPDKKLQSIMEELNSRGSAYYSDKKPSIGLRNVLERLKILYNGQAHMSIESEIDVGTSIYVRFPSDIPGR